MSFQQAERDWLEPDQHDGASECASCGQRNDDERMIFDAELLEFFCDEACETDHKTGATE